MIEFDIATAPSAVSKKWANKVMGWPEFVERLTTPTVSNVTVAEYRRMTKSDRSKVKDVGGYVGGYLRGGRRIANAVMHRQIVTLDVDYANQEFAEDFLFFFGNAAVLHTTFSHSPENPRYRLIIPVDRELSCDEYMALSRRIAGDLNIELFDNTTFEPNRLMFWPAHANDGEFIAEVIDGPVLIADDVLGQYVDWTDTTAWPSPTTLEEQTKHKASVQANPLDKDGWVGAFCRAHSIHDAIGKFLSEEYESVDGDRYTYTRGSTSGGLVTYDDKFAYSHHGTDPISGQMCNAFDLVRIHKFGHLDDNPNVRGNKRPSFGEMIKLCQSDTATCSENAKSRIKEASAVFENEYETAEEEEVDVEWVAELEADKSGKIISSATNIDKILRNDPKLRDRFLVNEFENRKYIKAPIPWRKQRILGDIEPIINVDYAGIRNYLETVYGISASSKIDDSMSLVAEQNRYHPVREYLSSLSWDGHRRISDVLFRVFGAEQNAFTAEALVKTMVGACARVFEPGCKFDLVLVLIGEQGTGKSTFLKKLGGEWFSDTFTGVTGKEAFEQIRGAWLIEIAELAALRKAEVEAIKHFITKQSDEYRPAYGREREKFDRQCVFIGTTNEHQFLRDATGNRRFMPVVVRPQYADITPFSEEFEDVVPQLWAEAMHLYRTGEPLYLSRSADAEADKARERHTITDDRQGLVKHWLDIPVPKDWDKFSASDRQTYYMTPGEQTGNVKRQTITLMGVWVECFYREPQRLSMMESMALRQLMDSLPDWKRSDTQADQGYGKEYIYERIGKGN